MVILNGLPHTGIGAMNNLQRLVLPGETPHKKGILFLCLAVAAVGFSMSVQMGVNANYLFDVMKLDGGQVGYLEAFRESCGIWALGFLALMAGFAEPLVGAAMLVVFGVALGSYAYVPNYGWLIIASLFWSQGLHIWMPLPNSMMMAMAEPGQTGRRLGEVHAAGAAGAGLGLVTALILDFAHVPIRPMYLFAGTASILGAAMCLGIPRNIKTPGPRLVFRKKYGFYYLLCFLEGWRKQIFVAFAGYLLVWKFGTPLRTILMLWILVQAIGWVVGPRVGHLIDRIGERRILLFYYLCLTLFFVGYAVIESEYVLYAIFVIDSAFFVFSMALNTYVNRIAPKSEHTPTLSMGIAMNHLAAVTMPLVGGLLWQYAGYQWTFLIGAAAAILSVIPVMFLPGRPAEQEGPAVSFSEEIF
jgi:MFS family permease